MKLFISYSRQDKEVVRALVEAIAPFHRVWIDWKDIKGGDDWRQEIEKSIRRCDVFLFVVSFASCSSQHCAWECEIAIAKNKRIIPLILDDGYLRPELAQLQWIFMDEFEKGVRQLLEALQPSPPYPWMAIALVEALVIAVLALRI